MIDLSFLDKFFGDRSEEQASPKNDLPGYAVPRLTDYLPYRSFDEDSKIFFNSNNSYGFVLEITPLLGADDKIADLLANLLSDGICEGTCIQVLSFQSPRVGEKLKEFALPRLVAGGVLKAMAEHRVEKLASGAFDSLANDGPFHVRHHRSFISVSIGEKDGNIEYLLEQRESFIAVLKTLGAHSRVMTAVELISLIDDLTSPSFEVGDHLEEYSRFSTISDQCIRKDVGFHIDQNRILIDCEPLRAVSRIGSNDLDYQEIRPDRFDYRFFAPRTYPAKFAPWDMQKLIGDMFADRLRFPCPVVMSLTLNYPNDESQRSLAAYKNARTASLAEGTTAKIIPKIKDQSAEWRHVLDKMSAGAKLVNAAFFVGTMSPLGKGDAHERAIKSLFKSADFDLIDARQQQSLAFLSCFPMSGANGICSDLDRMNHFSKMLTNNAAAFMPIQGEYVGGNKPHCQFIGRRGEPFNWSPFENTAGNHNVAVFGKSGSGKSVALQELCASMVGVGAKVIVIDDGRSFEHLAKIIGGDFVEFRLKEGFSVNPFSMIDGNMIEEDEDYLVDVMAMLKSMVCQMARHVRRVDDLESGFIDRAVNEVWQEHGQNGSIDQIIARLKAEDHPVARDLAMSMFPFSSEGTFGSFFTGKATVNVSCPFVVFELSDLASREELRSVVLTAIMFLSSQTMRRMDRSIPKVLMIDEAWQMLKAGSMADFVETYARTCRKYGGSLVTATQSIGDYYKSAGSQAALENSDWSLVLEQKAETINDFKSRGRFQMDSFEESLVRSLKRSGTSYSDLLIKGPDVMTVGRLVLDPYSATIYSSSPDVVSQINALVESGEEMAEAVKIVAFGAANENDVMMEAAE